MLELRCLLSHIKQTPLRKALGVAAALLAQGAGSGAKEWDFGCVMLKPHLLCIHKLLEEKSFPLLVEFGCCSVSILNYVCVCSGFIMSRILSSVSSEGNDSLCWHRGCRSKQLMLPGRWQCFIPWWLLMCSKHLGNLQPLKLLIHTFPELCGNSSLQPHRVIYLKGFTGCSMNDIKLFFT